MSCYYSPLQIRQRHVYGGAAATASMHCQARRKGDVICQCTGYAALTDDGNLRTAICSVVVDGYCGGAGPTRKFINRDGVKCSSTTLYGSRTSAAYV